ncbi:hypothetical protein PanWU01x14_069740 [Parasponia andersonii]|uniref:Uncharacterized protein n=1 Tax=Parasponia andersonii TaxID=3476 RepID=A0A2P5DEU1_PARAD|nr:hypothetical protein PanWU01x14_069740 [Parasponia andersonii]
MTPTNELHQISMPQFVNDEISHILKGRMRSYRRRFEFVRPANHLARARCTTRVPHCRSHKAAELSLPENTIFGRLELFVTGAISDHFRSCSWALEFVSSRGISRYIFHDPILPVWHCGPTDSTESVSPCEVLVHSIRLSRWLSKSLGLRLPSYPSSIPLTTLNGNK